MCMGTERHAMADEPVLQAHVGEWLLGRGDGAPTIRLTVESAGGNVTVLGETRAAAGDYKLVRCEDAD